MTSTGSQRLRLALMLVVCAGVVLTAPPDDHTKEAKVVIHSQNIASKGSRETPERSSAEGRLEEQNQLLSGEVRMQDHREDSWITDTRRDRRDTQLADKEKGSSLDKGPQLLVEEASPYCTFSQGVILCDFKWTEQTVYLPAKPKVTGTLKTISIHQVLNLLVSESVCYDLDLDYIRRAQLVKPEKAPPHSSPCACCTTMLVQHVESLDRLPRGVGSLATSSSNITEVVLDRVDKLLTISQTNIERLRVSETIDSHVEVTFYEAHIQNLEKLHLAKEASLSMEKSNITNVSDGAFVLASSGNNMRVVDFLRAPKNTSHKVSLKNGGDLTLTYVLGNVTVTTESCPLPPPPAPCPKIAPAEPLKKPLELLPDEETDYDHVSVTEEAVKCPTVQSDNKDCEKTSMILLILLIISFCLNAIQLLFNQPRNLIDRILHHKYPTDQQYYNSVSSSDDVEKKSSDDFITFLPLNKDAHKNSSATVNSNGSEEVVHFDKNRQKVTSGTKKAEDKRRTAATKRNSTEAAAGAQRRQRDKTSTSRTEDRRDAVARPAGNTDVVPKTVQFSSDKTASSTEKEVNPLLTTKR